MESQDTREGIQSQVWVKINDISLTCLDKRILTNGKKLTDKHINLAQRILKVKSTSHISHSCKTTSIVFWNRSL